jgi:restriction system protein
MEEPPPISQPEIKRKPPVFLPPVVGKGQTVLDLEALAHPKQFPSNAAPAWGRWRRLPWPVWIVLAITLPILLIFGPAAAGIAVFGGAIGLPVLLLAFLLALSAVGAVTLFRSLRKDPEAASHIANIVTQIAADESMRQVRSWLRKAMTAEPIEPCKQRFDSDDEQLRKQLLTMDPFAFERHVMSFFQDKGLFAWVTRKSNDAGVDGFARHRDGLVVVQCKRNSVSDPVGRPTVQQFKGVVEENVAYRGFLVTTSYFTAGAIESAAKNQRLRLIDMPKLVDWHRRGVDM